MKGGFKRSGHRKQRSSLSVNIDKALIIFSPLSYILDDCTVRDGSSCSCPCSIKYGIWGSEPDRKSSIMFFQRGKLCLLKRGGLAREPVSK